MVDAARLGCEPGQGFYFAKPMDPSSTWSSSSRSPDAADLTALRPNGSHPSGMQHSYEALDRPGGYSRVRLFAPLCSSRLPPAVGGMSVSLLGDGLFLVALAWQVYAMSDAPAALATVGIAMTIPTIACLLIGGAVSDRFDRRLVMLAADTVRAVRWRCSRRCR